MFFFDNSADDFLLLFYFYICGCFVYMYVCGPCLCLVFVEVRRGSQFPETGVTDSCKFPCRSWELNLGPSKEQSLLLTTGPSLQLLLLLFGFYIYLLIGVQDRKVMSTSHWAVEKGCRICWLYLILEKKIYLELV